ncbi:MAG: hydrogenase iron-sulfur subunit [Syntrophobacteraceae bacterium]|nr:hydrogenase iron-sulfur subunit [Syntrophobacteraceae bacterium]
MGKDFEPKIMVFVCNWCPLGAVDSASRTALPRKAQIKVLRVLCSGMVDPGYVMKAFASGADGVVVIGCPLGNCHYISGNIKALRRAYLLRNLLVGLGVEEERFRLEWIAHAEQHLYVEVVQEMSQRLRELGRLVVPGLFRARGKF